jgi:hypothetical protein
MARGCHQKRRVLDCTTNLKHQMDLHIVQFSSKTWILPQPWSSLSFFLTMFSHTPWSSLWHNGCLHKINRCDCIHLHLQNTPRAQASSSPSMFIKSLTTTQPKIALQKQIAQAIYPCTFLCISHLPNFTCLQNRPLILT